MKTLIAIMYHRIVKDKNQLKLSAFKKVNNSYKLTKKEFNEQIDYLTKNFSIINFCEFKEIIQEKKIRLKKRPLLLTFDDGTKDHIKYVTPILKKKKISGIFFVPGRPVLEKKALHAHAIHEILINTKDKGAIVKKIDNFYLRNGLIDKLKIFKKNNFCSDQFNNPTSRYIKKMLQIHLPIYEREKIISYFFHKNVTNNETDFVENFYLNENDLEYMQLNKMVLLPHSINHYHLTTLSKKELEKDILDSINFIKIFNKDFDKWISCYPFGSFDRNVKKLCKKYNAFAGFTTKSGTVNLDRKYDIMELPRIHCDEIGKI